MLRIAGMAALASACATEPSRVMPALPALVQYPADLQARAGAEIDGGACPVLTRFVEDYGAIRARIGAMGRIP